MRLARLAPLAVFVGATAYFLAFVPYGFYLEDEGTVLWQIARTYQGQVPYIDFHTGYTPGLFYGNALLFQLFGVNVVALRVALALVNGLAAVALFALAWRVAPAAWAIAGVCVYTAFLPFFGGEFASFNIPYPSWYVTLLWLVSTLFLLRWEATRRAGWLLLTGIAAGGCFCFKPNAGVFAAAAAGLGVLLLAAGRGPSPVARLAGVALAGFGAGIAVLFGFALVSFEMVVFTLPWLALGAAVWRWGSPVAVPAGGRSVLVELLVLGVGVALPTLPWLAWLAARMPTEMFLREVLLIGGDVQQVYRIPYPLPEWWALALSVAVAALAFAPAAIRRGHVSLRTLQRVTIGVGIVTVVVFVLFARMPEGLALSVIWQLESAAFVLVPIALGAAVWWVARLCRTGAGPEAGAVVLVVVSALAMLEQMNPRLDFMHLVMAVPGTVPVVALVGAAVARAWRRMGWGGQAIGAALLVVPLAVAGLRLAANLERPVAMDRVAGTTLLAPAGAGTVAPVGVETAVGEDLRQLGRVVEFVKAHTGPEEPVFGFPAMAAVNFLAGRPSPVRHDYFFPGRPAHTEEAEVVAALVAARPPWVVTLNERFGFFQEAPAYYLLLRNLLRRDYTLALRAGRYDVLRYRGRAPVAAEPPPIAGPVSSPDGLDLAALTRAGTPADLPRLLTALRRVHRSRRAELVAVVLVIAERHGGLAPVIRRLAPSEADELMLVRSLGEFGDARALDYLTLRFATQPSRRMRSETGRALAFTTARLLAAPYTLADAPADPTAPVEALSISLPPETLEAWLRDRKLRRRVGAYAAVVLGRMGRREATPLIRSLLALRREGWLQTAAARALVDLRAPEAPCDLVGLLASEHLVVQTYVPSLLLELLAIAPESTRACLAEALREGPPDARAGSAWVAGVSGDATLVTPLLEAMEDDDEEATPAVVWALGEIGDGRAAPALATARAHGSRTVRAFAADAERKLGPAAVASGRRGG